VSGERQWTFPLKTRWWEAPATSAGRVFAGSTDGTLSALDAATGRVAWQTPMGGEITTTITRHDASLYLGPIDGRLHRVESESGKIASSQQLDTTQRPRSVPMVTSDAVFVLLTDAGEDVRTLVSLTPSLDRIRWRTSAPPPGRWMTTRILATGNLIVLGTSSGSVTAYCANDGTPAWSHTVTGTVRSIGKAEGGDDTLYVGTVEGHLYAIDPPLACGAR
jgi:outer membrane protein assembly factor BamB